MSFSKNALQPWIVCLSAALFFFYEFIQMNMFNSISSDLMRDFSIDATQLGYLSAFCFYANILFLPIAGVLIDRFSTRKIILSMQLLCSISIAIFALSHSFTLGSIGRFMGGIGNAFCFLSCIRLASHWFPAKRMALISGLIVTIAMIGGVVAQTPLASLVQWVGWRHALLLDCSMGLIFTVIIWKVVQDYPSSSTPPIINKLQLKTVLSNWRVAYLSKQNWLGGIYTCLMNLPLALLGAIWGGLYLTQVEHFSRITASYIVVCLFIGTIVGGPALGHFSDRIQNRRLPMLLGAFFSLLTILIFIYIPGLSLLTYFVLFFTLGFFSSTQIISYPLVTESNPKHLTATCASTVSISVMSGYAIFQPVFGWFMDRNWQGSIIDNVHIYSASDYHSAMLIMPIGFVIAFFAVLLMRETFCRREE